MTKVYEQYHKNRNVQKKIISDNDFTYQSAISFINKYVKNETNILDIGCGVGTIDFYLGSRGHFVLGVDISSNAIKTAKKCLENFNLSKKVKFRVMNFPNRIPNGHFDVVICSEVLEHLKKDKIAVLNIYKLVRKGGIVLASAPSLNATLYKIGMLRRFDKSVGHLRRYSEKSFKQLFEEQGFKILETKKTEGVLRNFLFTNSIGGIFLRILNKWPISKLVTIIDNAMVKVFGESNIYLVAQKI